VESEPVFPRPTGGAYEPHAQQMPIEPLAIAPAWNAAPLLPGPPGQQPVHANQPPAAVRAASRRARMVMPVAWRSTRSRTRPVKTKQDADDVDPVAQR
jgi:hypothetical protein